jgi:hypothetical protein
MSKLIPAMFLFLFLIVLASCEALVSADQAQEAVQDLPVNGETFFPMILCTATTLHLPLSHVPDNCYQA